MSGRVGVTVVAEAWAVDALAPLLDLWRHGDGLLVLPWSTMVTGHDESLTELAQDSSSILVVGPRNRSPRTVLPGPVVRAPDGRVVPAAWLPATTPADLARFAGTAVTVHGRSGARGGPTARTLAVLGERQPRFDRLADRIVRIARDTAHPAVEARRCTAYELGREDLVDLLGTGPAIGVYVGHGRPTGWVGYAGLRAHHFTDGTGRAGRRPAAAVVSLTCKTASRRRTGLSFAEALPLIGATAATVGAVGATVHTANARWALRVARDLGESSTIGELVAAVAPHDPHAAAYRLIGDPTAPLLDAAANETAPQHHPLEEAS